MGDAHRYQNNIFLVLIGLGVLLVTLGLTYVSDTLYGFRGSLLAYLGWQGLFAGVICGFLLLRLPDSRKIALVRNVTLTVGLVVICLAVVLCITIERMMPW